jgi:hypothetical protein
MVWEKTERGRFGEDRNISRASYRGLEITYLKPKNREKGKVLRHITAFEDGRFLIPSL